MTSELIRCFVCLELPRESIEYLEEVQQQIRKKNLFRGNFTEPENFHLTLKFLGEIPKEKVEEVKKKLKEVKFKDFEVVLGETGVFSKKALRMLWIKLNGKGVWDLQDVVDEKMSELRFIKEERFMSHITLARIKEVFSKNEFLDYVKNLKIKKLKFPVSEFVLKKSELKEEGPIYTDLERYKLN